MGPLYNALSLRLSLELSYLLGRDLNESKKANLLSYLDVSNNIYWVCLLLGGMLGLGVYVEGLGRGG